MAIVLGLNAFTHRSTAFDVTTPLWVTVTNIRDETVSLDTSLADITTRKAAGWRLQVGTLSEGTVDANVMYDTSDADFTAFQDAYFNKTPLLMAFMDGDIAVTGNQGLKGAFMVTTFGINRQLEEAMAIDITFTATADDLGAGPIWFTVPV